jgi:hypothetical protein
MIFANEHTGPREDLHERTQRRFVPESKRRVGLLCRSKILLDPNVDLLRAALKPQPAADGQGWGLRDLHEAEKLAEEAAPFALAVRRRGELHMIDALERGLHFADEGTRSSPRWEYALATPVGGSSASAIYKTP